MVLIYQPPNAHVRISWILLRNAMAAAAVKKIIVIWSGKISHGWIARLATAYIW
jgi:hypothetical protein